MSASAAGASVLSAVPRLVFSLALIAGAGWLLFKGVQFLRFGALEWAIERAEDAPPGGRAAEGDAAAAGRREWVTRWRDDLGLRDRSRQLYFRIGQRELGAPPPDGLQELAAAIRIDPARTTSWMDLAQMSWADIDMRPLSLAAWEMSGITGPYEYADVWRRVQFLSRRWVFAQPAQKQRFVYEVDLIARPNTTFAGPWHNLLRSLPARQREQIQGALGSR